MHQVVHRTMQWMTPQDVLELRHVMSHPIRVQMMQSMVIGQQT